MKKLKKNTKPRNFLIKDLMTPKYRLRVAVDKTKYSRQLDKSSMRKEVYAA